jgi:hypothetical protein
MAFSGSVAALFPDEEKAQQRARAKVHGLSGLVLRAARVAPATVLDHLEPWAKSIIGSVATSFFKVIPYVALFALVGGHALMLLARIIRGLQQTGGFPSSHEQLQKMAERIDEEEWAERDKRDKRRMLRLWIGCAFWAGIGIVGQMTYR